MLFIFVLIVELQLITATVLFWLYIQKRRKKILIKERNIELNGYPYKESEIEFIAYGPKQIPSNSSWVVVHDSVIGWQHKYGDEPTPCQDNNKHEPISDKCGIAVVCDGAGSACNSDLGSEFVSKEAVDVFKKLVIEHGWNQGVFPEEKEWCEIADRALTTIYSRLKSHADTHSLDIDDLACTVIVLIYVPEGLLFTHIGDGRAAYQNADGEWISILQPHKGNEANQTIFITNEIWMKGGLKLKGITVPESIVIKDDVVSFALMSDGCERHCFDLGSYDKANERFIPANRPHPGFFNPLRSALSAMVHAGVLDNEISKKWRGFLEKGTDGLRDEPDDKTMILGIKTT